MLTIRVSTTPMPTSSGHFIEVIMYLLGSPVLEGTYKDTRDHSDLTLQVLRKTYILSITFSFEKCLLAIFLFCF